MKTEFKEFAGIEALFFMTCVGNISHYKHADMKHPLVSFVKYFIVGGTNGI